MVIPSTSVTQNGNRHVMNLHNIPFFPGLDNSSDNSMSSLAQTAQFSEKSRLQPDPRSRVSNTQLLTPHHVSGKAEHSTSSKKKNKKPGEWCGGVSGTRV